jgi:hypothetical protein
MMLPYLYIYTIFWLHLLQKILYYFQIIPYRKNPNQIRRYHNMAKSQDSQKDTKKKPTRTAAEKKALKQEKKKNK